MQIAFDGVFYKIPDSIKHMLSELESCLEITDSAPETANTMQRRSHHGGDFTEVSNFNRHKKKDGRYAVQQNPHRGGGKRDHNGGGGGDWPDKSGRGGAAAPSKTTDTDWEIMRSFKATKIEAKTGIEKTVNDIRIALNKMSSANYEKQKTAVIEFVAGYFGEETNVNETDTRRISKAIFDIASTNKFYSEIYARLYKELIEVNPVFRVLLDEFVEGITNMDNAAVYVDPDVDYDGFCVYSKACDIRKSTSTFLVNCLKYELILPEQIVNILCEFLVYVESHIREEGFSKFVEEVIENVFIIVTMCRTEMMTTAKWAEYVLPALETMASKKTETFPSLSSRAVFKCMDLVKV